MSNNTDIKENNAIAGLDVTLPDGKTQLYPEFANQSSVEVTRDFPLRGDDIVVSAYPKCGTTWTQMILHLLINGGVHQPSAKDPEKLMTPFEAAPWILARSSFNDELFFQNAANLPSPRLFSIHACEQLAPRTKYANVSSDSSSDLSSSESKNKENQKARFIYLVRNPKDCAVSYYFHTRSKSDYRGDWNDFFNKFVTGSVHFGSYLEHMFSWWRASQRGERNVLWVKYEDLKNDPKQQISRMAEFLGLKPSDEEIDNVVERSSFKYMVDKKVGEPMKAPEGEQLHMRKGQVRDWENYFTVAQSKQMDKVYLEHCCKYLQSIGCNCSIYSVKPIMRNTPKEINFFEYMSYD